MLFVLLRLSLTSLNVFVGEHNSEATSAFVGSVPDERWGPAGDPLYGRAHCGGMISVTLI